MIRIITVVKLTETFAEEKVLIVAPAWECTCVRERGRESEQTNMLTLQQTRVSSFVSPQRDPGLKKKKKKDVKAVVLIQL